MLQPNQPIGQQAPQGMQRAPGQQTMPAGAAMQRGILPGGIASNPEDIKAAYGGTPQGQQKLQQAAGQGDYLSAIALSQILEEERQRAATKATQTTEGGKPPPVVDRMREEAVDLRRQDLEEQQAKRLGMENQRSQSAMAQMAMQAAQLDMAQKDAAVKKTQAEAQQIAVETQMMPQELQLKAVQAASTNLNPQTTDDFEKRAKIADLMLREADINSNERIAFAQMQNKRAGT